MSATSLLETPALPETRSGETADFAAGMMLTAVVPAAFWTAAYAGISSLLGYETSAGVLAGVACGVSGLLALVFAALRYRAT